MNWFKCRLVSLLTAIVIPVAFGNGNSLSMDKENTLKLDNSKTEDVAPELPAKDPEQAKTLRNHIKEIDAIAEEAGKLKDARTEKLCNDLKQSLEILAAFHENKDNQPAPSKPSSLFKDKTESGSARSLADAYQDYKQLDSKVNAIKMSIDSARRNTPEAKKQRKFQIAARQYQRKAQNAVERGKKTEAQYYMVCAKIMEEGAKNFQDASVEDDCRKQLNTARNKYLEKDSLESAARFRKRAASMRKIN
ncbi:MAG: hypothetical protein PHV59_02215, partial [Victivallales bacterium]|nr:hypothetical protein [Victivallales bacterium]